MDLKLKELIANATNPQAIKGQKWGSGDARTTTFSGDAAIELMNQSHWQDCVWFRPNQHSDWVKASGYIPLSENQKKVTGDGYFWTQEKLSKVYLEES